VFGDFDVMGCFLFPREADPVLIVDAQAVLPAPVSLQCFQAVARWGQEIRERLCAVERCQAAYRNGFDAFKSLDPFAIPQALGFLAVKASDQVIRIARYTLYVKRTIWLRFMPPALESPTTAGTVFGNPGNFRDQLIADPL
jgi:hypothetical protein